MRCIKRKEDESLVKVDLKKVENECRKVQSSKTAELRGNNDFYLDLREATCYLESNGFRTETFSVDGDMGGRGICFWHKDNIIRKRGHLTLLDSTFNVNRHEFYLFSLLVRDDSNTWIPEFQFLCSRQTAVVIQAGLQIAKTSCNWHPVTRL